MLPDSELSANLDEVSCPVLVLVSRHLLKSVIGSAASSQPIKVSHRPNVTARYTCATLKYTQVFAAKLACHGKSPNPPVPQVPGTFANFSSLTRNKSEYLLLQQHRNSFPRVLNLPVLA